MVGGPEVARVSSREWEEKVSERICKQGGIRERAREQDRMIKRVRKSKIV